MSTLSFAEAVRRAERRDSAGEPDRRFRVRGGFLQVADDLVTVLSEEAAALP